MNTKPFLYGLQKTGILNTLELEEGNPADIFLKLQNNKVDLGIISVGALLTLPKYFINTQYCIAADGEVASVCIFSQRPITEINTILLDYQSRSSVLLTQIICKFFWKRKFTFLPTHNDSYYKHLQPNEAALIIGDRALRARVQFNYIYDLGLLWKQLTHLPFVFAVWGSKTPITSHWEKKLNQAFSYGLSHINEVIAMYPFEAYPLHTYYAKNIKYILNADKMKAIALYKQYIEQL